MLSRVRDLRIAEGFAAFVFFAVIVAGCGGSAGTSPTYGPVGFSPTGSMIKARSDQTATLLSDGRVLVAGGYDGAHASLASAEIYDPSPGQFSATGSMQRARYFQTATLLRDGQVLVAGGYDYSKANLASSELYDPRTGRSAQQGR